MFIAQHVAQLETSGEYRPNWKGDVPSRFYREEDAVMYSLEGGNLDFGAG